MTPNRIYQAVVEALETSLAPRVVSLVLREGLAQVEREPSNLRLEDVDAILTGAVFKQLQARMSADAAREAVASFREQIDAKFDESSLDLAEDAPARDAAEGAPIVRGPAGGRAVEQRLGALREALRPFNLYFDWPEVRKLRAQLQVAEGELNAGTPTGDSLDAADEQLHIVEQKLEDRLVLQARELGELEESLEIVQTLGGPRVRRLESLIGQIRHAQLARELADAETQRAATLARDLRKLMESSVAQPFTPDPEGGASDEAVAAPSDALADSDQDLPPVTIDEAQLTPEVSERLRALDVDAERRSLEALAAANADLLRYAPGLVAGLDDARATLDEGRPLGDALEALKHQLDDATTTQRAQLRAELAAIEADLSMLGHDDDGSLERALRVALDVLSEGLPAHADVVALRELHQAALVRAEERERRELEARALVERKRAQQQALRERIARTLDQDAGRGAAGLQAPSQALRSALAALDEAESEDRLDEAALERALQAEQRWEHALAERADDDEVRRHARLRELEARIEGVPDLPALRARAASLRAECVSAATDPHLDDAHLATLSSLVDQLHADALDAVSNHLERLAQDAGDASDREVLGALQAGARTLQAGRFPDIERLQALVVETRERLRDAERVRWQRLQHASARLEPAGVPGLPALTRALEAVRSVAAAGRPITPALDAAEAALDQVETEVRDRLATFAPRLDAALLTFARVQRLNTDEVATVRRVLTHLDTQRDALSRISPGLQHQLERSLDGAERLLEGLAEAFEATRAVADQLVSANLFDDMLGLFDGAADDDETEAEETGGSWRDSEALQALLAGFRGFDDVDAAMVISSDGTLRAGDVAGLDLGPIADALRSASAAWLALGERLEDAAPELVDVALGARHALLTPLGSDAHALVLVRSDGAVSALTARLRDTRSAMVAAVAAAT
jgi:chromosome segregation protein